MQKRDVVIIGGSAAGIMTATTVKRRYPNKQVTMIRNVSKTPVPCGIPYIYGTLKAVEKNIVPDNKLLDMGIEIIFESVETVQRADKTVHFDQHEPLQYDKLVLATGSKPMVPPLPGVDLEQVFTVAKNPFFLQKIFTALKRAQNVVIIGGGFIGTEMAEQISYLQQEMESETSICLVEMLPTCLMMACEQEFGKQAEEELARLGVQVHTSSQVKQLLGDDRGQVRAVELADGRELPADLVILGIGALPNIELAEGMGLKADTKHGIEINERMETADPDIYAAGDCANKFSFFDGKPSFIRLASVAAAEGLIAASNLYGRRPRTNNGTVGAFATQIGDRCIGAAGYTSRAAQAEGIDFVIGEAVAPNRHPGGLPGCIADTRVKMLFRRDTGHIIGGHVCGGEATAEMANVIAVAIQAKLTAEDLATMQYATHPLLTASPTNYHIMLAAEFAAAQLVDE